MKSLYIVGTPIGNLEDITLRALEILKKVDFICCENPRHSQRLLQRYDVKTPIKPLSQALRLLKNHDIAIISDAGTPGISDPIIQYQNIIPIPGPSALTTAISAAGIPVSRFLFLGFIPHKKKRNKYIQEVINSKYPVIFYESPHRILKTLSQLPEDLEIIVCQELTKIHETIQRGRIKDLKITPKGEFVVIVKK